MTAAEIPAGFKLTPINGEARTIEEWLITFQLLTVVLDPFTYESSWLLETAGRVLHTFRGCSVRTSFVVTSTADEARQFLGPWADKVLTYIDPNRDFVRVAGLSELPALVHVRQNRQIEGAAQGWQPMQWRAVAAQVANERHWTRPVIPVGADPLAFAGSPAIV